MPRMNGHEALPLLRDALPESTKIVVLTSGRAEDERERALAGGADGFVVKPESVFALGAELRCALRRDAA
jgi:DNA-binding NarL/FixJ family response regulator